LRKLLIIKNLFNDDIVHTGGDVSMSTYTEEDDYYIIPKNYTENGKILGIIEKQSFIIGSVWGIVWAFILYFFPFFSVLVRLLIFIVLGVFPAAIIFVGIGHDTVVDYIKYYLQFSKNAKVYKYEK
jgi:hypothetical protein